MASKTLNWMQFEVAKAGCIAQIRQANTHLAMLEIVQAAGGEMKALTLAQQLITRFNDHDRCPWDVCQEMGFAVDEMIDLARLV